MSAGGEHTASGNPIVRHTAADRQLDSMVAPDSAAHETIKCHIESHIGKIGFVLHEIVSELIHLDVVVVEPTPDRNYFTLVTLGMSDRPMNAPKGQEKNRFAELLICLPPSWPLKGAELQEENRGWPIQCLKQLGRLPHEYNSWLFFGHTVPNGNPPKHYALDTQLCCAILLAPLLFNEQFVQLKVNDEKTISFLSLIPLYKEEMEFKLKRGTRDLLLRLKQNKVKVTELLDVNRSNTCKKLFGIL